jgi:N-acetyl sugar amidotransferase
MKYCTRCVIPDTRPNIEMNAAGVCNACTSYDRRDEIDWQAREASFRAVVKNAKARAKGYDCMIPVSGGKDSTWQVVTALEYGLNPLTVSYQPPLRTDLGRENLSNLISLGVDHIDFRIDPKVEKKFLRAALSRFGNIGIPMHMAIFNFSLSLAARFDIPLVIWGENSGAEYGGAEEERHGHALDRKWVVRYGVSHGTTWADWVSPELSAEELLPYVGPSDEDLERRGTKAVFLGYYFPWDPEMSAAVAKAHGFRARDGRPRTGYYDFSDLDDHLIAVHHYLKWFKFGFTRTFDNLSIEIRKGKMTREEAIRTIRRIGDDTPIRDIERFCAFVEMSTEEFFAHADAWRDPSVWVKRDGTWQIDGFIVPDWKWT